MKNILRILVLLASVYFISCAKENYITGAEARLSTSIDTLKFDTVFTSAGSVTRHFTVLNENDQKLKLSAIKLMGGSQSPFKININGSAVNELANITLAANDSLYIFVSVYVDPNAANLPFLLSDSIQIQYNGNTRYVQLQAYGQNAIFLNHTIISSNTTWSNTLPYVILGSLQVDTGVTLTLPAGVKIYSHANAPFIVDGTLLANGSITQQVVFAGDRLDEPYINFPASWPGIYFSDVSTNNRLTFTVVKNAYQAITVSGASSLTNTQLWMQQCIIDNAYQSGLYCLNAHVEVNNCLFSNSKNNIFLELGGLYRFTNCTSVSYSTQYLLHHTPVLATQNYTNIAGIILTAPMEADFINCIFWGDHGDVEDEMVFNRQGPDAYMVNVENCIYKTTNAPVNAQIIASIANADPAFDSIDLNHQYFDFRISNPGAPGIDQGQPTPFLYDLDNKARDINQTDMGCYEKQ
ncbi:MAG: hypothetical protein ABS68_05005 [Niastella sp. SCN 39-18]|nr:hypothetical protein [Sphingobacteriales bacterium]ODT53688.1 MAG: hypothetical protein ABS68_05005 [Niastella sp. SCN 39-18]OJW09376.1 MAG: hypothetical protein BGO53_02460 [Sphingobacteriales bacterium 39-19]